MLEKNTIPTNKAINSKIVAERKLQLGGIGTKGRNVAEKDVIKSLAKQRAQRVRKKVERLKKDGSYYNDSFSSVVNFKRRKNPISRIKARGKRKRLLRDSKNLLSLGALAGVTGWGLYSGAKRIKALLQPSPYEAMKNWQAPPAPKMKFDYEPPKFNFDDFKPRK